MPPYLYACSFCGLNALTYLTAWRAPSHPSETILDASSSVKLSLIPLDSVRVILRVLTAPNTLHSVSCGLLEARKWVSVILIYPIKNKYVQTKSKLILLEKLMDFNQNLMLTSQTMRHALYVALGHDVTGRVS